MTTGGHFGSLPNSMLVAIVFVVFGNDNELTEPLLNNEEWTIVTKQLEDVVPYVTGACGTDCRVPGDLKGLRRRLQKVVEDTKCPSVPVLPLTTKDIEDTVKATIESTGKCKEDQKQCKPKDRKVANRLVKAMTALVIGILAMNYCGIKYHVKYRNVKLMKAEFDQNCSPVPHCNDPDMGSSFGSFSAVDRVWYNPNTGRADPIVQSFFRPSVDSDGNELPPQCHIEYAGLRGNSDDAIAACEEDQHDAGTAFMEAKKYLAGIVIATYGPVAYGLYNCMCIFDGI